MNLSGLGDLEIWSLFKQGDKQAFLAIYSEYARKLYLYGLKFSQNEFIVEDVIQDLFTELIKNREKLGPTDNILFYLLKAFKRKLLRKIKAEKRFIFHTEIEEYKFEVTWSVEHELISEEISVQKARILLAALSKLTPRQKEAIYLRFTRELDYESVAEIMDISVEGCRNLISKAIQSMKKEVSEKIKTPFVFFHLFSLLVRKELIDNHSVAFCEEL